MLETETGVLRGPLQFYIPLFSLLRGAPHSAIRVTGREENSLLLFSSAAWHHKPRLQLRTPENLDLGRDPHSLVASQGTWPVLALEHCEVT